MPWRDLLQYSAASTSEALRFWHARPGREVSEGTPKSTAVDGGICNSAGCVLGRLCVLLMQWHGLRRQPRDNLRTHPMRFAG